MTQITKDNNIGILYGGWSDERKISLESGEAVFQTLKNAGYSVFLYDLKNNQNDLKSFVKNNSINIVFNLVHGTGGEDGTVQLWLENIGVRYIGSDSKASILSFSKLKTKKKWKDNGLKTPSEVIESPSLLEQSKKDAVPILFMSENFRYVMKPDKSGSSVGIKILYNEEDFKKHAHLLGSGNDYFIEEYVKGSEYTAPIIGDTVFPIIKIETKREFYNYQAKYIDDDTNFSFPEFKSDMLKKIESTCLKAFHVLGCKGWGRVDFFINSNNEISLIEVNTIPGMTSHSLVPMSAKKKGYTYLQLVELLLNI